jgi:hypothetical protein
VAEYIPTVREALSQLPRLTTQKDKSASGSSNKKVMIERERRGAERALLEELSKYYTPEGISGQWEWKRTTLTREGEHSPVTTP